MIIRIHRYWNLHDWKAVMFADSTSIELHKRYRGYKWKKRGNRSISEQQRVFVKKYIRAWAVISYSGKSKLIFIDRLTKKSYLDMLKQHWNSHILVSIPYSNPKYILHDNEKIYFSDEISNFLRTKSIRHIESYPPNSGDLNIIEACWFILKKQLSFLNIKTLDELKENAANIWENIDMGIIKSLVKSMPNRIKDLDLLKGEYTKY